MKEQLGPARQGLYDPQHEHDSCGVGFVVDLKGRKSREDRPGRHPDPAESRAPRRLRRGEEHRRRRRHPHPDPAQVPGRGLRRGQGADHAAGARRSTASAWFSCPATRQPRRLRAPVRAGRPRRGAARARLARGPDRQPDARADRAPVAAGHQAAVRRPPRRRSPTTTPSSGSCTSSAGARATPCAGWTSPRRRASTSPASRRGRSSTRGCSTATSCRPFYPDLQDERVESALALVHSRFSTNTFPSWSRAHPYRMIAHNGEINTLRGNVNWMHARESMFASKLFGDDLKKCIPVIDTEAATRGCSTTCSSCSFSRGGRCRTR